MPSVLNLTPTVSERLASLQNERADVAARLASLRGAEGWTDAEPTGRPVTRLEREALALAEGRPVADADPDAAVLQRRLAVIDRALELLDGQAARLDAVGLQRRVDDTAEALAGHVSAVVKKVGPLVAGLPALRELADDAQRLHIERSLLADRVRRGGDLGALPVRFRDDVEHAAGQVVAILERAEQLVKDAAEAGLK